MSAPRAPRRFVGIGRLAFALAGILLILLGAEMAIAFVYAAGDQAVFVRTFSWLAFFSGLGALAVAAIGATPGRIALKTQRRDRLSVLFPVQDPGMTGVLQLGADASGGDEPGAAGIFTLAAFGAALMAVGYFLGIA